MKVWYFFVIAILLACGEGITEEVGAPPPFDGDIQAAKDNMQTDSIRGWLSAKDFVGSSINGPYFFQDDVTAIEVWFPAGNQEFKDRVEEGYRLTLIGDIVKDSRGIYQIHPTQFFIRDSINPIEIGPTPIGLDSVASDNFQNVLVRLFSIESISPQPLTWQGDTDYIITDSIGNATLRIDANTDIPGNFIGSFPKNLSAIVSKDAAGNPILLPRKFEDFRQTGFGFIEGPVITDTTQTSVTLHFVANFPADYSITYGINRGNPTPVFTNTVTDNIGATTYDVTITGLTPASLYDYKVVLFDHDDTIVSASSQNLQFTTQ